MAKWRVRIACEIAGKWRETGETVEMSADEARFLAAPFGNVLLAANDSVEVAVDVGLKRRKRERGERSKGLGARPAVHRKDPDNTDR